MMLRRLVVLLSLTFSSFAYAGEAEIVEATLTLSGGGTYRADVTILHEDTGWDHYADGWAIELPDGTQIGYRTLYHPHVEEQPFTRSLSGIEIPKGVDSVVIRAHDSVHGFNDEGTMTVSVPR